MAEDKEIVYKLVVDYVDKSFGKVMPHFERTVHWVKQLYSKAGYELLIAAYGHDIERAFKGTDKSEIKSVKNYTDPNFLRYHQERGAELLKDFLMKNGQSDNFAEKVFRLISKHEVGGDNDQNFLMCSDSISFFETNAEHFVKDRAVKEGYEPVKEKLDWMFNRINLDKAKMVAKPLYLKWSSELKSDFGKMSQ